MTLHRLRPAGGRRTPAVETLAATLTGVAVAGILVAAISASGSTPRAVASVQGTLAVTRSAPTPTRWNQVPTALASAIHTKLGAAPLGMGRAPLVTGIAPAPGGWQARALDGRLHAQIGHGGSVVAALSGQPATAVRPVAVSTIATRSKLLAGSAELHGARLVQHLGGIDSTLSVTTGGLEQRFSIRRPADESTGTLRLEFRASAGWAVIDHGSGIATTRPGRPRLAWRALRTTDATGHPLRSHFAVSRHGPRIVIDTHKAQFPLSVDPTWTTTSTPQATLTNGDGQDQLGFVVALSADGTTAAVGASGANTGYGLGAVYIFHVATAGSWTTTAIPAAELTSAGTAEQDAFAEHLAISADGTTVLVGAWGHNNDAGAAYVYHVASASSWSSTSTPTAVLTNAAGASSEFGDAVTLSSDGTTALIGATGVNDYTGAAYIYHVSTESSWATSSVPTATLASATGSPSDDLGTSVALSGDGMVALIGADGASKNIGAAYVYETSAESAWTSSTTPNATLTSGTATSGSDFGLEVAMSFDGTTAAINQGVAYSGTVEVYQVTNETAWATTTTATASLTEPSTDHNSNFGQSIAISHDDSVILVGAYNGYGNGAGAAYVYVAMGAAWSSTGTPAATLTNTAGGSLAAVGRSVALSGDGTTALIGAPGVGSTTGDDFGSGAAYIYQAPAESSWTTTATSNATLTDGHAQGVSDDYFGDAVAVSSDGLTALVGAYGVHSNRGAAYIFHVTSTGAWNTSAAPTATLTNGSGTANDYFGWSVAISPDGTTALVGAYGVSNGAGAAYVYQVSSPSSWISTSTPTAVLKNGAGAAGDNLGAGVALSSDGTTALIGADCASTCKGAADIFHVASETSWATSSTPAAILSNSGDATYDYFGDAVSLSADGTTALIGDYEYPSGEGTGSAYIYQVSSSSSWSSTSTPGTTLTDPAASGTYDWFGVSVALSPEGTTALVGASYVSLGVGAAYVYQAAAENAWPPSTAATATLTDSAESQGSNAQLGYAVALSSQASVAVVGAYNANNVDGIALVYEPKQIPTQLAFTGQPPATVQTGTTFTVNVTEEDANGNPVTTDNTTPITLTITPGTGTTGAHLDCTTNPTTVTNGVATFTCSIDTPGTNYTLTATATGLTPATSNRLRVTSPESGGGGTQTGDTATTTSLVSSSNPSYAGDPVTFTATVTPTPPSGTIQFAEMGESTGCSAVPLDPHSGTATCTITFTGAGSYDLQAYYSGDGSYLASQSPALTQAVVTPGQSKPTSTSTAVSSSSDPAVTGQRVTYVADVTPVPDGGSIRFLDDGRTINNCRAAPVSRSTSMAACVTTYEKPGTHLIQAVYNGTSAFTGSQSGTLRETVRWSLTLQGKPSGRSHAIRLVLRCASGSGGCHARIAVTVASMRRGSQLRTAAANAHPRVLVAHKRIKLDAGGTKRLTIRLDRRGRRLLARVKRLRAQLTVRLRIDHHSYTVATRRLTIKPGR